MLRRCNLNVIRLRGSVQLQCITQFSTEAAATATTAKPQNPNRARKEEIKKMKFDPLNIHDAVQKVKELAFARFDETVEIALNMGLDPRKPNQSVKGIAKLPSGSGKKVRVMVFAAGQDAKDALDAGADTVGAENLIAQIQGGDVNYNTVLATPDMMSHVSKVGRILGPRGLMPNPKLGTVTKDVVAGIKAAKAGNVKYKVEKKGVIQAGVGKVSFSEEALLENIRSLMISVLDNKPEGLKGKYIKEAHLCSTQGPSIPIDVQSVDPSGARFMLKLQQMSKTEQQKQ